MKTTIKPYIVQAMKHVIGGRGALPIVLESTNIIPVHDTADIGRTVKGVQHQFVLLVLKIGHDVVYGLGSQFLGASLPLPRILACVGGGGVLELLEISQWLELRF